MPSKRDSKYSWSSIESGGAARTPGKVCDNVVYFVMSVIVETALFSNKRDKLFLGDEDFRRLQQSLMDMPGQGDVIPGTGGLRKMRWAEKSRGKGKRSGLRVIYLHLESASKLYLITVYSKDERDDLSPDDKRLFKALSESIHAEVKSKAKKGRA